jgi:hypothetical protein
MLYIFFPSERVLLGVAEPGLELIIHLPGPPECWDYNSCVLPYPAKNAIIFKQVLITSNKDV